MVLYLVYLSCLFFSFFIGIIYRKALERRQLSLFIPYLLLVFFQELGVFLYLNANPGASTAIIYNIYRPVSVGVYGWIYYHLQLKRSYRMAIPWIVVIFLLTAASIFVFTKSIRSYSSQSSLAGGISLTLFGILFLFDYFNLDNDTEEEKWKPVLWITAGIVIFYPVVNICFAFYTDIFKKNAMIFGVHLYRAIPQMLSILMYGAFAYAFYLCKKRY
jgi:hypothetical protein